MTDEHDWLQVTAPNGDRGWQCQRCRLTAITLPVPPEVAHCPVRRRMTAATPLGAPHRYATLLSATHRHAAPLVAPRRNATPRPSPHRYPTPLSTTLRISSLLPAPLLPAAHHSAPPRNATPGGRLRIRTCNRNHQRHRAIPAQQPNHRLARWHSNATLLTGDHHGLYKSPRNNHRHQPILAKPQP